MRERVNDDFGRQEEFYIISKVQFLTIRWVNSCIKPLCINFELLIKMKFYSLKEYYILVIFKVNYTSSSLYPITIYSL